MLRTLVDLGVRRDSAQIPWRAANNATLAKLHLKQKQASAQATVAKWNTAGKLKAPKPPGVEKNESSTRSAWPLELKTGNLDSPLEREIILDKPRRKKGKDESQYPRGAMTKVPEVVPAHVWSAGSTKPSISSSKAKVVEGVDLNDEDEEDGGDGAINEGRVIIKEERDEDDFDDDEDDEVDEARFRPRPPPKHVGPTRIPGSPLSPAISEAPPSPKKKSHQAKTKAKSSSSDPFDPENDEEVGEDMFDSVVGEEDIDPSILLSAHETATQTRFDYRTLYRTYDAAFVTQMADGALGLTTRSAQLEYWSQPMPWDDHVATLNCEVFGNAEFRPYQREALNALLCGENVLSLLPSGGGKSLLYQLPALFGRGAAIVVSPLLSLIQDQMTSLKAIGIGVRTISSRLGMGEIARTLQEMRDEELKFKILFVTPEKLVRSRPFVTALKAMHRHGNIRLFAVDEAHCISEWGHDFRPDYRRLKVLKKYFPNVPTLAVTGSCTPAVRADIQEQLSIEHAQIFQASVERPNIKLEVRDRSHDEVIDDISEFLVAEKLEKQCGLVFCLTRSESKRLAKELAARGHKAAAYHAKLKADKRVKVQDSWMRGEVDIMCSTVAFGLGINKANVRFVLHATLPTSLEAYYQHIGRAGRDGLPSKTCLFFAFKDRSRVETVLSAILSEDGEVELDRGLQLQRREKLDDMVQYCLYEGCRREFMLRYFGEEFVCDHSGDRCDMCALLRARNERSAKREAAIAAAHSKTRSAPSATPPTTATSKGSLRPSSLYSGPKSSALLLEERLPSSSPGILLRNEDVRRLEDAPLIAEGSPSTAVSLSEAVNIAFESTKSAQSDSSTSKTKPPPPTLPPPKKNLLRSVAGLTTLTQSLAEDASEDHQATINSTAMRMKETDRYVKRIAEIAASRPGMLSKNAVRSIARTRPTTYVELAAIKGVGKERAGMFKEKILAVFAEEEEEEED